MRFVSRRATCCVALVVLAGLPSLAASAQPFERPSSFDIKKLSGLPGAGENYTIKNPVRSDGLLRIFDVGTAYGDYAVHGDQMLRMRLNELKALAELEKISGSQSFGKALVEAGLSPLTYTGKFIADPGKTMGDTFNGIGNMFGRIKSDIANAGKTPGDPISGLLGVTDKKRELAASMGVDPYTDFPPLDAKLSRLAEAAAAGGLTVSAVMMVVPGAVGIVVGNLSTASTLEGVRIETLARDYTVAQIFDLNRERMRAMQVDNDMIEGLLANRSYTPIDMAVMVGALDSMKNVADRAAFFARASQIKERSIAYLMRRQAEMMAMQQRKGAGYKRLVLLGGYPFWITRDGRIVGAMPVDALSWPEEASRALRDAAADARRISPSSRVELQITGTATPLAKKELQALGWQVTENVRF